MRKIITYTLIIILCFILAPAVISANHDPVMPERYTLHVVQPGETLWGISGHYMPDINQSLGVHWIKQANGISNDYVIQPGDELNIPDDDGEMAEPWGYD